MESLKERRKIKDAKWRKAHPENKKADDKKRNKDNRQIILSHYSNGTMRCLNCGEDDITVLTVDHINNDGAEHRKKLVEIYIIG